MDEGHMIDSDNVPSGLFCDLVHERLGRHGRESRHYFQILLLAHLFVTLADFGQNLEIVNVKCGRKSVEKFRFNIEWV